MKLKYFLRGLGSGVVITSIILTLSFQGRNNQVSDAEIIKRAKELGMVQEEKRDLLAEANREPEITQEADSIDEEETLKEQEAAVEEGTGEEEVTPTLESTATPTPESTATPTSESTATPTSEPTATPTPEPTATPTPEPTATATPTPFKGTQNKKVITIVSGMWSDKVARELEAMGVVDSATAFDQYLVANGYANRIVVGTFEIPAGATYEQIAQIITTR